MRKFLAIALVVISLAACKPISEQINIHDYSIEKLDNVSLGLSQLSLDTNLMLEADNNSAYDLSLTKLFAELYNKSDKKVATVTLATKKGEAKPTLHRRTSEEVAVPLKVDFANPLSAITLVAMSLEEYGERGYTVDYDLTLKAGCFKKRFQGHDVPVKELVKMLQK